MNIRATISDFPLFHHTFSTRSWPTATFPLKKSSAINLMTKLKN